MRPRTGVRPRRIACCSTACWARSTRRGEPTCGTGGNHEGRREVIESLVGRWVYAQPRGGGVAHQVRVHTVNNGVVTVCGRSFTAKRMWRPGERLCANCGGGGGWT